MPSWFGCVNSGTLQPEVSQVLWWSTGLESMKTRETFVSAAHSGLDPIIYLAIVAVDALSAAR